MIIGAIFGVTLVDTCLTFTVETQQKNSMFSFPSFIRVLLVPDSTSRVSLALVKIVKIVLIHIA